MNRRKTEEHDCCEHDPPDCAEGLDERERAAIWDAVDNHGIGIGEVGPREQAVIDREVGKK